jgi:hypothetical protein
MYMAIQDITNFLWVWAPSQNFRKQIFFFPTHVDVCSSTSAIAVAFTRYVSNKPKGIHTHCRHTSEITPFFLWIMLLGTSQKAYKMKTEKSLEYTEIKKNTY